jgi:hypothetical protein
MDLKSAENLVLVWHDKMPHGSGEAALWLLERVQELETEKKRERDYHRNLERRLDDEMKGLREGVEKVRDRRPNSDLVAMNEHAINVLRRVKEGYGFVVYDPMSS